MPEFIVIGKKDDVRKYSHLRGAEILDNRSDWTPEMQERFIRDAVYNGKGILLASWNASGQYRQELIQILRMLLDE